MAQPSLPQDNFDAVRRAYQTNDLPTALILLLADYSLFHSDGPPLETLTGKARELAEIVHRGSQSN